MAKAQVITLVAIITTSNMISSISGSTDIQYITGRTEAKMPSTGFPPFLITMSASLRQNDVLIIKIMFLSVLSISNIGKKF